MVSRARLLERLNEGLASGRKLTLITAPAGFGKTTLVSEWVTDCQRPIAWLSLDEGDREVTRFLTYLIAALQTVTPSIGTGVLGVLQSPQPPPIEAILTPLLNEIATLTDNFLFILDDYHLLDVKAIDHILLFLVEHKPPQMHLVITTREDPSLPLARLRARNQLTELRAVDLRFTPSEAAEFLHQGMGLNLSAESISILETRTEGWIAGLQLAALSMQGQGDTTNFIKSFGGGHHFVLDYLVEEVFHQQSEKVQNFLLGTSILDRMCSSLCEAVLADASAFGQDTLEHLERANLFIVPLDNERQWYRYHHLFGSLLRQRLQKSRTSEAIATYHLRASAWYEANGEAADAFQHAIAAQDFSRAARLAEIFWEGMNESFQTAAWLGWVKQLPEALIRVRPVLCTQIAWAYMDMSEVEASESRLREAERCLENPTDEMVIAVDAQFRTLPARIALARTYNAQSLGDFPGAVKYAELALNLVPEEEPFLRAQTKAILGGTYWANGDLDAACQSMSTWIDSSQQAGNVIFAIASGSGKADILIAQGHLREALKTYQESLQLASAHENEAQRVIAHHHLGLALLYHERCEDESAAQHLQKSLEVGPLSTLRDWPYRRCLAEARLKEAEGDFDAALEHLAEAQRFYVKSLIPNTRPIEARKVRIYLKQGRLSKTSAWVREQGFSGDEALRYMREYEHLTLARVLLAEYQNKRTESVMVEILSLLERLLRGAEAQNRMGSMLEILIVQALAYQTRGDSTKAFPSLELALTLAQPEGFIRIFIEEGEPMRALLLDFRVFNERHPHGNHKWMGYLEKLISAFAPPGKAQQAKLIEPLSQREVEVLRLIAQGLSNGEISKRLFLALNTVKGHNRLIFDKLQVQNRTEAVARARELDLL